MKKITVLCLPFILAACAGGFGGTSGTFVAPHDANNITANSARNSNLEITAMVDNETQRTVYLQNALDEDYDTYVQELSASHQQNNTRQSARALSDTQGYTPTPLTCRANGTCNQLILDEMYRILVAEIDNWETVSEKDIIRALRVAGYKNEIATHNDDIKQWFRENKEGIKQHAQQVADAMGELRQFDLSKAEFYSDGDILKINLDETGKIQSIKVDSEIGSVNEMSVNAVRDENNVFNTDTAIYEYSLLHVFDEYNNLIAASEKGYHIDVVSKTQMTLDELKAKLLARLDEVKDGEEFFAVFGFDPQIHTLEEKDEFINAFVTSATNKINGLQSLDDEHIEMSYDNVNMSMDLETFGAMAGLAYSDFGFINFFDPSNPENKEKSILYGGYEEYKKDKNINPNDFNKKMVFTGRAVGLVAYRDSVLNSNNGLTEGSRVISGNADFIFNPQDTTETLVANFDNWYDVEIVKNSDSTATATFDNTDNKIDDNNFKFFDVDNNGALTYKDNHVVNNMLENTILASETSFVTGHKSGSVDWNYYGHEDSGISEVSGEVNYGESLPYYSNGVNGYTDRVHKIEVSFGFGGVNTFEPE